MTNKRSKNECGLKYNGFVTIEECLGKKVIKKSVIKNSGCLPLFKFFADCLTLYTASNAEETGLFNSKPQYLNAFYQSPDEQLQTIQLSGNSRLKSYIKQSRVSTEYSSDVSDLKQQSRAWYRIDIKFLLQDSNFITTTEEGSQINILALYSGDNVNNHNNPHAFIIINDVTKYIKYRQGVNYIITWSLKISN